MAAISSSLSPNLVQNQPAKLVTALYSAQYPKPLRSLHSPMPSKPHQFSLQFSVTRLGSIPNPGLRRAYAVAEEAPAVAQDPASEAARRLYVGNIPRDVGNEELWRIVEEHGAVEKAEVMYDKYSGRSRRFGFVTMKTVDDANVAAEKLNGTEVKGRKIKVNITEKPLSALNLSILQTEESQFVDSPHKVYVGNLSKTVTTEKLKALFAEKGKALSAKVSRAPGTSKSRGFGFVSFSSEEDAEAAISALNNSWLEGQKIRVNKA